MLCTLAIAKMLSLGWLWCLFLFCYSFYVLIEGIVLMLAYIQAIFAIINFTVEYRSLYTLFIYLLKELFEIELIFYLNLQNDLCSPFQLNYYLNIINNNDLLLQTLINKPKYFPCLQKQITAFMPFVPFPKA